MSTPSHADAPVVAGASPADPDAALEFRSVSVDAPDGSSDAPRRRLLHDVDWRVEPGEHWAVLGGNGAGKTTLLNAATGTLTPSEGNVVVLGDRLGAVGLRDPRLRMAMLPGRPRTFSHQLTNLEVVLVREAGPVALLGKRITATEVGRAKELLKLFGGAGFQDARYRECSQGERQRVLLARALMRDPAIMLLDEPTTALDLAGREALLEAMVTLSVQRPQVTTITVTHHVEELPASTTHALLLRDGRVTASGPVDEVLNEDELSACFGLPVMLTRVADRWSARARPRASF
jgi:iron complex transport system ATP-binding protein